MAVTTSLALCAALSVYAGVAAVTGAAAVAGVGVVAAAGLAVASRADRWSGPADRVTLARTVLIGGCATIMVLGLAGVLPDRSWWLAALAVPALGLDAVDGYVARRTGTASAAGARLDMEMDAALLLVLSLALAGPLGSWVLAVGAMRYLFAVAGLVLPWLRADLARSELRRQVAAVAGVALVVAVLPATPVVPATVAVALALLLLAFSFARDVVALERARRSGSRRREGGHEAAHLPPW